MPGCSTRRLTVEPELVIQLVGAEGNVDVAEFRLPFDVIPDVIDMRKLGSAPAEIFPDPTQDRLDLLGRFFRECRGKIRASDSLLAQRRADQARDPPEQVGCFVRIEIARGPQQADRERADRGFAERFEGVAKPGLGTRQERRHIFKDRRAAGQTGARVRISEAFWPPKPNELDITAVTRASRALLPTTLNWMVGSGIS